MAPKRKRAIKPRLNEHVAALAEAAGKKGIKLSAMRRKNNPLPLEMHKGWPLISGHSKAAKELGAGLVGYAMPQKLPKGQEVDPTIQSHSLTDICNRRSQGDYTICVNELWHQFKPRPNRWYKSLGPNYISSVVKQCKLANPQTKTLLADFGAWNKLKWDNLLAFASDIEDREALDGIGIQIHTCPDKWDRHSGERLRALVDEIHSLGLICCFTEITVFSQFTSCKLASRLSVPIKAKDPERRQAEIYAEIASIALESGVKFIGFLAPYDAHPWHHAPALKPRERPGIFAEDYTPKPAYDALMKVFEG